jgi:hypothetical protein
LAASGDTWDSGVVERVAVAVNYGREVSVAARLSQAENPALEICRCYLKTEDCVVAVDAAADDQVAIKRMRSFIGTVVPKAHRLLDRADGKTLGLGT